MHNTNGRNSTQGGRIKPSFEFQLITDKEGPAKQTVKDLGAKWGVGTEEGHRKKRKRPSSPVIPGGLG